MWTATSWTPRRPCSRRQEKFADHIARCGHRSNDEFCIRICWPRKGDHKSPAVSQCSPLQSAPVRAVERKSSMNYSIDGEFRYNWCHLQYHCCPSNATVWTHLVRIVDASASAVRVDNLHFSCHAVLRPLVESFRWNVRSRMPLVQIVVRPEQVCGVQIGRERFTVGTRRASDLPYCEVPLVLFQFLIDFGLLFGGPRTWLAIFVLRLCTK